MWVLLLVAFVVIAAVVYRWGWGSGRNAALAEAQHVVALQEREMQDARREIAIAWDEFRDANRDADEVLRHFITASAVLWGKAATAGAGVVARGAPPEAMDRFVTDHGVTIEAYVLSRFDVHPEQREIADLHDLERAISALEPAYEPYGALYTEMRAFAESSTAVQDAWKLASAARSRSRSPESSLEAIRDATKRTAREARRLRKAWEARFAEKAVEIERHNRQLFPQVTSWVEDLEHVRRIGALLASERT